MTNKEVANLFQELARMMEFKGENPFKIRSYNNAYVTIRRLPDPILQLPDEDISQIKGIGKAILGKLGEIREHGTFNTLERYRSEIPSGIRELLTVKGLGPKKIKVVHDELGVESIGELLYACNENRLIELKGFGTKTQNQITEQLTYLMANSDNHLYWKAHEAASSFERLFSRACPEIEIQRVGLLQRKMPTVGELEFIVKELLSDKAMKDLGLSAKQHDESVLEGALGDGFNVLVYQVSESEYGLRQFQRIGPKEFVETPKLPETAITEREVFDYLGWTYIPPVLRDHPKARTWALNGGAPDLLQPEDIRGVVHAHSTWSDGLNSLEDMAEACRSRGLAYLVITDHSQAAFYANGLSPERVGEQWAEIDELNNRWSDFKIFKGIESDILADGRLDYEDDILAGFDMIIASVHSNLRMDEVKATRRIIAAVENRYTTMLGHPTGRLLLSRKGYPLDHEKVIDACAANGVSIEVNANPYRLDLDWKWIDYALGKGIMLSINPDAHSTDHIDFIKYGVYAAQKGGMDAKNCLNTRSLEDFQSLLYEMK